MSAIPFPMILSLLGDEEDGAGLFAGDI